MQPVRMSGGWRSLPRWGSAGSTRALGELVLTGEIPPTPHFEVCGFCHGERRREPRNEVAVVLAIGHTLRTHQALGRPDALSGFLEVLHSLVKDGVFVGHDGSIRTGGSLRSLFC